MHCTVFICFVCSAVWHHCFRAVHLDPSPWRDIAPPPSWHLPGRRIRSKKMQKLHKQFGLPISTVFNLDTGIILFAKKETK